MPQTKSKTESSNFQQPSDLKMKGNFDFSTSSSASSLSESDSSGLVTIHKKRDANQKTYGVKRKRSVLVQRPEPSDVSLQPTKEDSKEYIAMVLIVIVACYWYFLT